MISKFRHSQKWLLKTINCSASNAGKLASENNFSAQKHIEKDFSTYSAKTLMESLEELKHPTRKQVTFTEQSQTRNYFVKKVVLSGIQFEIDGFTFPDSTEHLMPINWKHSWKQVSFYCMTQKDIFWTGCASAKKMISHLPTQHFCRNGKTNFEKNLTLASPSWKASSFPKMTFCQGSVSWKLVYTSKLIS